MAHAEKQCEKCRWFEWARDMNATIPYCNLQHEYKPEICEQYGTLEDVEKRIEQLDKLCHVLYRILELVGTPYDPEKINYYLDEDGFAQIRGYMDALGLLDGEQE